MKDDKKHSKFSPSSSSRWLRCTASVQYKGSDSPSSYAKEGTLAHSLVELGPDLTEDIASKYSAEMREGASKFHEYIKNNVPPNCVRHVEKFLQYNQDLYGTVDYVAYNSDSIYVIDYKYGKGVKVSAEKNTQLMLYALCGIREHNLMGIKNISLHIVQPRINNFSKYELTMEELLAFEKLVNEKIVEANISPKYVPGSKQCLYCPGKKQCNEYLNLVHEEMFSAQNMAKMTMKEKEDSLKKEKLVLYFYDEIKKDLITNIKTNNYESKCFKLTPMKRKVVDSNAIKILSEKGYDISSIADYKVKPLSKLEKVLKPDDLARVTKITISERLKNVE